MLPEGVHLREMDSTIFFLKRGDVESLPKAVPAKKGKAKPSEEAPASPASGPAPEPVAPAASNAGLKPVSNMQERRWRFFSSIFCTPQVNPESHHKARCVCCFSAGEAWSRWRVYPSNNPRV